MLSCRYSPDDKSSGSASPSERRRLISLPARPTSRSRTPVLPGKVSELSQHDSKMSSECSSDETVIYVVKPSSIAKNNNSSNTDDGEEEDEEEEEVSGQTEPQLPKIYSTVNSVSSQDSGINLSFQDSDRSSVDGGGSIADLGRSSSAESNGCPQRNRSATVPRFGGGALKHHHRPAVTSTATNDDLSEDDEIFFTASTQQQLQSSQFWHCPPKNVWKPSVEAMQEFDMIKDADRVLLCLSPVGGRSSLTLLHTLHQYRFYARSKGVDFEIGVASVGDQDPAHQEALVEYFKNLNVPYFHEKSPKATATAEEAKPCTSFCDKATRAKLYAVARSNNYNVLALAQNLDDLTEGFLRSVFNNGKLKTMKAHYSIRERSLRVIRPFVYVRDKAVKQFIDTKKLPACLLKEDSSPSAVQVS